jgi:hypothetical protein
MCFSILSSFRRAEDFAYGGSQQTTDAVNNFLLIVRMSVGFLMDGGTPRHPKPCPSAKSD